MSDEDKEYIDVESDEDGLNSSDQASVGSGQFDKRAHHNALERKRRDHIKESFNSLRDVIPVIQGEKASRAQILKNATDYITNMKIKSNKHKAAIEELRSENQELESQIAALERMIDSNDYSSSTPVDSLISETEETEEVIEQEYRPPRRKKAKN